MSGVEIVMTRIENMQKSRMMMVVTMAGALALAGCADAQNNPKTTGGAIIRNLNYGKSKTILSPRTTLPTVPIV